MVRKLTIRTTGRGRGFGGWDVTLGHCTTIMSPLSGMAIIHQVNIVKKSQETEKSGTSILTFDS